MSEQLLTLHQFERQPAEWRAAVGPAVSRRLGAVLWLDTEHAAYVPPGHAVRIAVAPELPAADHRTGPWDPLHRWAATADLSRVAEGLDAFQATLPTDGFNRRQQFADARSRHPLPERPTRYQLCRWTFDRHADAPAAAPRPTYAEAARRYGWPQREPYRFCYGVGSNRLGEPPMIASMIRSARAAGVAEDFHVFSVGDVPGAVNHHIPASRPWQNFMTKVDLLAELAVAAPGQDAYVWMDTDHWFVRDPGDLTLLLRGNPIWVGLEGLLRDLVYGDWWGIPREELAGVMTAAGAKPDHIHGTNGGMVIVRGDFVAEFHQRMWAIWHSLQRQGFTQVTEEVPMAILGSALVDEPAENTTEGYSSTWACDWASHWRDRLPDGRPWPYSDWGTGRAMGLVNPAIVHNMRGKHLMR